MKRRTGNGDPPISTIECRPGFMIACLAAGDLCGLALAGAIAIAFKLLPNGNQAALTSYISLIPLLPVFLLVYAAMGLYDGISLGPPEELRRLTLASVLVSLFLGVLTVSFRGTGTYLTSTMMVALILSIVLVPLIRVCIRLRLASVSWWGYPTVVFGDAASAHAIIHNLVAEPGLGLRTVGFFSTAGDSTSIAGVPSIRECDLADFARRIKGPAYAVLTASVASRDQLNAVVDCYRRYFSHILVVPGFTGLSCLWVNPKNLGGMLGLEICQQVFLPGRQFVKRVIDLVLTILIGIVAAPLIALIALAIRLDSEGKVVYRQRRIGRGGREFYAIKFRSMVENADQILARYLAENSALREEWGATHKLKNDPRITRLGRFLRRTSLDELPQLWNVIRGEMSLVGPRPIVREEIAHYGFDFETYTYVHAGLTGLWQVSGRSDTSYQQRVDFDRFYVENWSVWLDFCILFRTIGVVVTRAGAV
jgi:Undecaprenyl-phosphate galactose phosphotransferase WbaP